MLAVRNWIDKLHNRLYLDAIQVYQNVSGNKEFTIILEFRFQFFTCEIFFLEDGTPKYYQQQDIPIDIHCPGTAIGKSF